MFVRTMFVVAMAVALVHPQPVEAQRIQAAKSVRASRHKQRAKADRRRVRSVRRVRGVRTTGTARVLRQTATARGKRSYTNWARRKPRRRSGSAKHRRRITITRDPDTDRGLRRKAQRSSEQTRKPLKLRVKNRGRLATLEGIRKGKKYRLTNPTTGKLDARAVVISTGTNKWSKVPYAEVKFSNGHIAKYAAERLNLAGKSRAYQKKYIRAQRKKMFAAIKKQLGRAPKGVKLKSLRGRNVQPRNRKLKNGKRARPHLGPFIVGLGEKLQPREGLLGYQIDGQATVSRHHAAFDIATPTHEVLHGMSQKFIDQMFEKGLVNTLEGITDYFTFKVVQPHYGIQQKPNDAYRTYTLFAEQIAKKIGDDKLEKIFFGSRGNLVQQLSRAVDKSVGKKGAFMRAARQLEKDKLVPLE